MKVLVKWLKSPLKKYGLPYGVVGNCNLIERSLADKIQKESPDMLVVLEQEKPPVVKDTMATKTRTRPVRREKKD